MSPSMKEEQQRHLVVRMKYEVSPMVRPTGNAGPRYIHLASCLPFLPHRAPAAQHAGKKGGTQVTCLRGPLVMKMSAAGGKEPSVALSAVMAMNDLCPG